VDDAVETEVVETDAPTTTAAPATTAVPTTTTTLPPETTTTSSTTTSSTTTTDAPGRTTTTTTERPRRTTTTTTEPAPRPEPDEDVYDPACVIVIRSGDTLNKIAVEIDDETVTAESLARENGIVDPDQINAGAPLDICVDNGLDDVRGAQRVDEDLSDEEQAVVDQQEKLNELFAGSGIRELIVDGISGPVTQQRLCAWRLAAGLPVNRNDMEPGSKEEKRLMRMKALPIPFTTALNSDRWGLIDMTCQIMFVGSGADDLQFVFNVSTGESGYGTRLQDRSPAFRYDPAAGNDGWHDSSLYPVTIDNPLNGNMYKPIYFDGGQAIHGAVNVPTSPQSKGCVRTRVEDQQALVDWLGLGGLTAPSWSQSEIDFDVNVQGDYRNG
jgi:LysM repeat protein